MPDSTPQGGKLSLHQQSPRGWLLSHSGLCFAVLSVGWVFLLYRNVLAAPFVYDDISQIKENPALASWPSAFDYFRTSISFSSQYRGAGGSFYRPLFWLSLSLDRHLWDLDPAGYHATNLLLHWLNGLLGFLLLRRLNVSLSVAAVASLVWLALPINAEAVAWISGRALPLACFFLLKSLLAGLAYLHSPSRRLLAAYAAACLAALLSHEAGVLALPFMVLVAFCRDRQFPPAWIKLCGAGLVAGVLYGVLRQMAGAQLSPGRAMLPAAGAIFAKYLYWMVLPLHMSIERSTSLPRAEPLPMFAASGLLLVLLVSLIALKRKQPAVAAGLVWLVVGMLPFCGLIHLYQGMAERYTYLASMGLAFVAAALAWQLRSRIGLYRIAVGVICIWVLWGAWRLNARVLDWRDEETLYRTSLEATPASSILLYNLGVVAAESGRSDEAAGYYRRALTLNPRYASAALNLGNILRTQGHLPEAIAQYQAAIALDPKSQDAWMNLGNVYLETGSTANARTAYQQAISLKPKSVEAYINLGVVFQQLGDFAASKQSYERALAIDPSQPASYCDLGALLLRQGDHEAATRQFLRAIEVDPIYAPAYFDLGVLYQQTGHPELAEPMYERALQLKPDYEHARTNLEKLRRSELPAK
ncbi:MAG: tetratricopeptide repeat protein [Isosphaeraceae bacterium]